MRFGRLEFKIRKSDSHSYSFAADSILHYAFFLFFAGLTTVFFISGCKKSAKSLISELNDKDPDVRCNAAEVLGDKKDTRAVEPLIDLLKDNYEYVRSSAAEALGKIGDKRAVEPLIASLNDNELEVCRCAAIALGRIGDTRAVEPLMGILKNNDSYFSGSAAEALGNIGDKRAVESLISALKYNDEDVRRISAEALGKIRDTRAVESLIITLKDNDEWVRSVAAEALERIGDARAIESLITALRDSDINVRESAAKALDALGWQANNNRDKEVYLVAKNNWDEFVKIGKPSVEFLITALKDNEPDVRKKAAETLGNIGDLRALEALITTLKDNEPYVRWSAASALGKIRDARAVEPLVAALTDKDEGVRRSTANALIEIGDRRIIPSLINLMQGWYSGKHAVNILQKFEWLPVSIENKVHYAVAVEDKSFLMETWDQSKNVLLNDISSNEYRVIENALYAFIALGRQELIPELINILNTKGNKIMAEAYLNCGHKELASAARTWATRNGYTITIVEGGTPVGWGSW